MEATIWIQKTSSYCFLPDLPEARGREGTGIGIRHNTDAVWPFQPNETGDTMLASILRTWNDNPCIFAGVKAGVPALFATLWGVQSLPPSVGIPVALGISSLFTWLAVRERSRPNLITAQSNASINQITEMARVFAEVSKEKDAVNHEQTKFWREQHAWAQKKETLIRVTKHNVQDAYGAACNIIQDYEEICRSTVVKAAIESMGETLPPKHRQRRFREIVGNEDRKMVEELFSEHLTKADSTA